MSDSQLTQLEMETLSQLGGAKTIEIYQDEDEKYFINYFVGVQFILDSGWRTYAVYNTETEEMEAVCFDTLEQAEEIIKEAKDGIYPKLIKQYKD